MIFHGRPGRVGDQPEKGNRAADFFVRRLQVQGMRKTHLNIFRAATCAGKFRPIPPGGYEG